MGSIAGDEGAGAPAGGSKTVSGVTELTGGTYAELFSREETITLRATHVVSI